MLIDLLISLLTRPQAFLRDAANHTFRQFVSLVDDEALDSMLKIAATRNEEAGQFLSEAQEGEEEVSDLDEEPEDDMDESDD